MNIVYKNLTEITPYENNPRMNENGVEPLVESIKEFGFKIPIIIDKDGVIVAGHTRYKAAMQLGMEQVPCIVADDLNEKQIKAFRIADNKTSDFSIWDNKLLLNELEGLDDIFTGFGMDLLNFSPELLDESDKSLIDDNEIGVYYEVKFQSTDKEKIEKIIEQWNGDV